MRRHTLKIRSELSEIHEVEKYIENICDYYNINDLYFGNIIVAVTEAVENAIIHGNKFNSEKIVIVNFETNKNGIVFSIEDEGSGFNYNIIPDPTDSVSNIEKKGTGVFLIKALTDKAIFLDNGRKLQLQFNINSIDRELYTKRMQQVDEYFKVNKEIFEKK